MTDKQFLRAVRDWRLSMEAEVSGWINGSDTRNVPIEFLRQLLVHPAMVKLKGSGKGLKQDAG